MPVLAHPAGIAELAEVFLPALLYAGLQGLECYYGEYDEATVARLLEFAGDFGLIPTGGSDYHGPNMHPTPLGGRHVPANTAAQLRAASARNHAEPSAAGLGVIVRGSRHGWRSGVFSLNLSRLAPHRSQHDLIHVALDSASLSSR